MSKLENALREALAQTLETMAFTEVEPGEQTPAPENNLCCACLSVVKPLQGSLSIELGEDLLASIAGNIYGEDMSCGNTNALLDSLGEIANIVLGGLVARLIADDPGVPAKQLQLALPTTGREAKARTDTPQKIFCYSVEGRPLRVVLQGVQLLRYDC